MKTGPRVSERPTSVVASCPTCGALLDGEHVEGSVDGARCMFCGALQDRLSAPEGRPQAPAPIGVGDTLRTARGARRERLEHAASETHIHERFLRALEDDEPPDAYPGAVYGRYFLREYADHLDLDAEPLLEAYDRAAREDDSVLVIDPALPRDIPRGRRLVPAIATIGLVAVAWLSWGLGAGPEDAPLARTHVLSAPSSSALVRPTLPIDGARVPAALSGVRATVRIVAPSWVRAIVDGRTRQGRTLEAGAERSFRADRTLELTLGNPAGARVWVNGHRVPTGPSDQVAHLSFTWRHGRVVEGRR